MARQRRGGKRQTREEGGWKGIHFSVETGFKLLGTWVEEAEGRERWDRSSHLVLSLVYIHDHLEGLLLNPPETCTLRPVWAKDPRTLGPLKIDPETKTPSLYPYSWLSP